MAARRAKPGKMPCSTTPVTALICRRQREQVQAGVGRAVENHVTGVGAERLGLTAAQLGSQTQVRQPPPGMDPAIGTTSTGRGKRVPSRATSFSSVDTTI